MVTFFDMNKGIVSTGKYMERRHNEHATFLQFSVARGDFFEMVSVVEEYLTTPGPEHTRIRDDGYARVQAEIYKYNDRTEKFRLIQSLLDANYKGKQDYSIIFLILMETFGEVGIQLLVKVILLLMDTV